MSGRAKLTQQQKKFCIEYLKDCNQTQAAIRAGYSKKCAQNIAHRVFNHPQVQAYLQPLLNKTIEKTLAEAIDVLEELSAIAMSDIVGYYKKITRNGKELWVLKDPDEFTKKQRRAIAEIKPGEYIKLHSKDSALDKLAKHYKLYTDLEAGTAQFNLMPVLRINGKEVVFEVGKPAPVAKTN